MNPSSKETPNLNLPPPVGEGQPVSAQEGEQAVQPEQAAAAAPETASRKAAQAGPPAAAAPVIPVPAPPTPPTGQQSDDTSTTKSITAKVLDDPDLIEKEWVNKAKQIVERTRDDPHRQSEELTVVKADYMKQRYDKTIKLNK